MATVSAASIVGWVVSPVIKRMVSLVQSYLSSRYNWKSDMVSDLKNLEVALLDILLVVGAAERQHVVDTNQILLMHQMKEAVCDAEDVLDEFDYMLLKEKVEQKGMLKRIASSSLSIGKCFISFDKFRSELCKVLKSVQRVRSSAEIFVQVMALESANTFQSLQPVPTRATGSLLHEDVIVGREKEVGELVDQLVNKFDECSLSYGIRFSTEVHTIVGVGGIGKTTLAQLIYNDERITYTFDLKIWVCISNNFDKIRITKEIIACTTDGENAELTALNFSMLQDELKRRLSYKRFLLVLDDVWYDERYGDHINKQMWMELLAPIRYSRKRPGQRKIVSGSKILVTTRTELVARMLDSRSSFFLEGLGRNDSWLLFSQCAFGSRNPEDYPELKRIGDQIVQKLKGSALALKVIGGHLNGKYSDTEWDDVLHENLLTPNDMLTILRLSYESLPEHLKQCFAYCSLFPKDYLIDPNRLIRMWIAQGFVHQQGSNGRNLEDIGRGYFNDLLTRSFFQVLRRGDQTYYTMHDSMNDLALHVSQGECFRVDHGSSIVLPYYVRHLCLYVEQLGNLVINDHLGRLWALVVLNKSWFCSKVCMSNDILNKLRSVRVLDISGCCFNSLPEAIGDLIHLRYLDIRRTYYPLPATMSRLNHLQALFVQYHSCCSSGSSRSNKRKHPSNSRGQGSTSGGNFVLPESITRLSKLEHVNVERGYTVTLSSMHQSTCVEGSGEFLVDKDGPSLLQLKDLNMIRGDLTIRYLENVKSTEEAAKAQLDLKEHITKLFLEWGSYDSAHDINKGFEVFEVLKPHSSLCELTISGYPGVRSPSWLEFGWLRRLEFVCLRDCERWDILPPLGNLPLLRGLEIRRMDELKTLGPGFFGSSGFPSLQSLLLERLPKLEWSVVQNDQMFPNLRHLSVAGCPRLTEYPTYPRTLRHIAVLDRERIQVKTFIDRVELSRSFCCVVSSFFHVLHSHHLEFIENLEIYVNHFIDMSRTVFTNLKSLKGLKIYGVNRANTCSLVTSLWDENGNTVLPLALRLLVLQRCYLQPSSFSMLLNNLSSLVTLQLSECDTVEMPCPPVSLNCLRSLKQLHIYRCDWISYFDGSEALVSLEEMTIRCCYDLEFIPDLGDMPCLQKLDLYDCPQVMRLSKSGHQTALKELNIGSCIALSSLEELCDLVSLAKLSISDCPDLLRLPDMDGFYLLRVLEIYRCYNLRSLPQSGLPVSLERLSLFGCCQVLEEQFQRKEGPDWDKVAALQGCMCNTWFS